MTAWSVAILTVAFSAPLGAQWLNHPTPGIPRSTGRQTESGCARRRALPTASPIFRTCWSSILPQYFIIAQPT